jgi:predicted RNA-binding protein YlqC (UPF0109 family)
MRSDATPAGTGGPFEGPDFPEEPQAIDTDDDDGAGNRVPGAALDSEDHDGAGNRAYDAQLDDDEQDLVNRAPGGVARAVLEHVARSIVDEPDAVEIDVSEGRSGVRLSLRVSPSDMGRVIGRRGRVAQSIRTLVRAAAAREGGDAVVDIVDD